jgi:hypothetical protein
VLPAPQNILQGPHCLGGGGNLGATVVSWGGGSGCADGAAHFEQSASQNTPPGVQISPGPHGSGFSQQHCGPALIGTHLHKPSVGWARKPGMHCLWLQSRPPPRLRLIAPRPTDSLGCILTHLQGDNASACQGYCRAWHNTTTCGAINHQTGAGRQSMCHEVTFLSRLYNIRCCLMRSEDHWVCNFRLHLHEGCDTHLHNRSHIVQQTLYMAANTHMRT